MKTIPLKQITIITTFLLSINSINDAAATTWKPICPEHVACSRPAPSLPGNPLSPFIDQTGSFWLNYGSHFTYDILIDRQEKYRQRSYFRLSPEGVEFSPIDLQATLTPALQRGNTIQLKDKLMVFSDTHVHYFTLNGESLGSENFTDRDFEQHSFTASAYNQIGSPVVLNDIVYVAAGHSGNNPFISHRLENGQWQVVPYQSASILHLAANPSGTGLWALNEAWDNSTKTGSIILQESLDQGATWHPVGETPFASYQQGTDGSWPIYRSSLITDPQRPETAYALFTTTQGVDLKSLYISHDSGLSWTATALQSGVNSLVIAPGFDGKRLIAGTEHGIQISEDGGSHWRIMSTGLFPIPHSIQYANGLLLASSAAGYFTCSSMDCFGEPLSKALKNNVNQPTNPPLTIPAIEFYNRTLDHYFLTVDAAEATGIDEGKAGSGWERTGHSFKVWPKLGAPTGAHACRFYGSVNPGPNSHFFSISPAECSQLLELQDSIPEGKPRWHLEDYPFMAVPKQADGTCPDTYQPVYRAYNNGFKLGKDSNHRFVTDRTLLEPLLMKGWADEGIGFCVPG